MNSPTVLALPTPARSELVDYSSNLFEVWESGCPSNRVRVLELSAYRAVVAASIHFGISAEKLRAQRVPNISIVEAHPELQSSFVA